MTRTRTKKPCGAVIVLATGFSALTGNADACEICLTSGLYDVFRFGVFWFYLLPIWAVIALAADLWLNKTRPGHTPTGLTFSRPALVVLGVLLFMSLAGAHFLVLLHFPFLLTPYLLPRRLLAKPISRVRAELAPVGLRWAAAATAVALVLSVPPAYRLPFVFWEAQMRSMIARTCSNMRETARILESHTGQAGTYPRAGEAHWNGATFSVLDISEWAELAKPQLNLQVESLPTLERDLFLYERRLLPRFAVFALFFPHSTGKESWPAFKSAPESFPGIQYFTTEIGFVLWSRGPDGEFSARLPEMVKSAQSGNATASVALANLTYDPTNGTISAGDIFLIGPGQSFGWPRSR